MGENRKIPVPHLVLQPLGNVSLGLSFLIYKVGIVPQDEDK